MSHAANIPSFSSQCNKSLKDFYQFPEKFYQFTRECLEYNSFELEQNAKDPKKDGFKEQLKKVAVITLAYLSLIPPFRLLVEGLKGLNLITKDIVSIKNSTPFSADKTKKVVKIILSIFFIASMFFSFKVGIVILGVYYLGTTSLKIASDLMKKNYTEAGLEALRFLEKIAFIAAALLGGAEVVAGFVLFKVFYTFAKAAYELVKSKQVEGYSFIALAVLQGLLGSSRLTLFNKINVSNVATRSDMKRLT